LKVLLASVRHNPFRDIDNYPIVREKIEALKASIGSTGFWDNIVARNLDGTVEIAYGHHRIVALREVLPIDAEIELIIRDLDDATMLRIMADENMSEWTSSAAIEQETISAVVRAYAQDRITLSKPNGRTRDQLRHAPSYRLRRSDDAVTEHTYTADTIAQFLRWPVPKVKRALTALAAIEADEVDPETLRGLGSTLTERVVQAARATQRDAERRNLSPEKGKAAGRKIAKQLAEEYRDGGKAIDTAITARRSDLIAEELRRTPYVEKPKMPSKYAWDLYKDIDDFFTHEIHIAGGDTLTRRELISLIATNRDAVELSGGLTLPWNEQIALVLNEMSKAALELADILLAEEALVKA
jgi:ParB-like chromosome segregation protein Spo0J